MKRKNTLLLCLVATLLMTAMVNIGTSASMPIVYVDPPEIVDRPSLPITTFAVNVSIADAVEDVYSWSIRLNFNPFVVNVVDTPMAIVMRLMASSWLGSASGHAAIPLMPVVENDLGYVFVGEYLDAGEPNGATGSGILVTINFGVTGEGITELDLDPTKLNTVIAGNSVPIIHVAENGLFDNRQTLPGPTAYFVASKYYATEAEELTFDASGSSDLDGWIESFEWDFGDGTTEVYVEGVNLTIPHSTTHAFALGDLASAIYTVTLTVTDNDGQPDTATGDIEIVKWIIGGYFPDLVGWSAKPERHRLNETPNKRGMDLRSLVGNPLDEPYEVYVEFNLYSKDEVNWLGTLTTPTGTVQPGKKLELRAYFDASDPTWRCFSGSPEQVPYGYYHWFFHKYTGFASCYYKNKTTGEFEKGNVEKYFGFNVDPYGIDDIGVLSVTTNATEVPQGSTIEINVSVTNVGDLEENFDLTIVWIGANATSGFIGETPITLASNQTKTETFTWSIPGDFELGPYLIKALLPLLPYETAVGDNSLSTLVEVIS